MKRNLLLSFITLVIFSFLLLGCSKSKSYRSIKIFSFKGTCNIIRDKKTLDLSKEMKIKNNDELNVKEESQVVLKLDNDKFVCVKENTDVKFVATGKENNTKTRLHVNNGGVIVEVKEKLQDKESFEIASSNSVMAIRGTQISFDVSKTADTVTTTFSILTGQTETFLYKDETMNSTTLIHDKMMSYTTSLNKTTDEIYKLYDKFKPVEITDTDLKDKYNTEKLDLTDEKANEIINVINDFEREEKIDERVTKEKIDFVMDNELVYGTSVLDHITNEHNLGVYYSSSINGTYSLLDSNTVLDAGSYYIKLEGDNYETDPKLLTITKKTMNFTMDSEIEYGTNILNILAADFDYDAYFSTSEDGPYNIYAENDLLGGGSYYIKLISKNYTTEAKTLLITSVDINLPIIYENVITETGFGVKISLDDNLFLNSPYAKEMGENSYTYYVNCKISENSTTLDEFTLDYENRSHTYNYEDTRTIASFTYTFNLPIESFNVTNDTSYTHRVSILEAANYSIDNSGNVKADIMAFSQVNNYSVSRYYSTDGSTYTSQGVDGYGTDSFNVPITTQTISEIKLYYVLTADDTELARSSEVTFDLSNLAGTNDFSFNLSADNDKLVTYNSDGTVNIYYDLGFNNSSDYDLSYIVKYASYYDEDETNVSFDTNVKLASGKTRYLVINNLQIVDDDTHYSSSYAICGIEVGVIVDGISYIIYVETETDFTESATMLVLYGKNEVIYGEGTKVSDTEYRFDVTANVTRLYPTEPLDDTEIVFVDYIDSTVTHTYTYEDFVHMVSEDEQEVEKFTGKAYDTISYDRWQLCLLCNYTEATQVKGKFLNNLLGVTTYKDNEDVLVTTDELFNNIKANFLDKYGIEIEGTYKADYTNVRFDMVASEP